MEDDLIKNLSPVQYWAIVIAGSIIGFSLLGYGVIGTTISIINQISERL